MEKETIGALMFLVFLILNAAGLIYYIRKFSIPAIKNQPAIMLDDEKLQYFIGNWEINWEDIKEITSNYSGVKVTMKDGETLYITCCAIKKMI